MSKLKAVLTVGVPCSGKTSWAEAFMKKERNRVYKGYMASLSNDDKLRQTGAVVGYESTWVNINRDDVRFESFCGGVRDWGLYKWKNESKVTDICNSQIEEAITAGKNIIVSNTNLNDKYRLLLIKKLEDAGYDVEIKEFDVSLEEAWKRDSLRPNGVGHSVIYRMYQQWLTYKGRKVYVADPELPMCVLVDVDGTVANMAGNRGPFEWDKVGEDFPISSIMDVVDGLYDVGYHVIFLSGRDGICYNETKEWLNRHFKFNINLYTRAEGDCRKDTVIKEELFWGHIADEYNVKLVIDDRPVMCRAWHELGIKVINVGNPYLEF